MVQADDTASTTSCNSCAQQTIHSLKEEAARRKKRLSDLLDKPLHKEIVLEHEKTLTLKSIMVVKTQADSLHNKGLRRVKLNQIRRRRMQLQNQLSKDTASWSCSIAAGGTASGSGKDDESAIFSIGSSSLSGPVVDHLPMDENSVSPQRKGAIDFSITTIREHVYIPGDNPAVMDGPPLSISWNHHSEVNISVDEFEQAKIYEEVKTQGELRMPASRRSQSKYNYHGKLVVTFGDDYLISSHHNQY